MILAPFMLSLGLDPIVSSSLTGFIVLFSSSSTTIQFTIAGAIHLEHAVYFMVSSFVGSVLGILGLRALIKKYKRPSILIWVVLGILCVAGLVLPAEMISQVINNPTQMFKFGSVC